MKHFIAGIIIGAGISVIAMLFAYQQKPHLTAESENKIVEFNNQKVESVFNKIAQDTESKLSNFADSANDIVTVTRGIIFTKEESAEKSYTEAIKLKDDNPNLSRIYILNAINHAPSNIKYLEEYYNIFEKDKNAEYDDIEDAISLLSTCVYQVDYEDIGKVNEWIESLTKRQIGLLDSQEKQNIDIEYSKIVSKIGFAIQAKNTASETDTKVLTECLTTLEEFLSDIQGNNNYTDYYNELSLKYSSLSEINDFITLERQLENLLDKASSSIEQGKTELAEEYLNLCDTVIFQMSGFNVDAPVLTKQDWLNQSILKKQKFSKTLNEKRSDEALKTIKDKVLSVLTSSETTCQTRINKIQGALSEISVLITRLYDDDSYNKAQEEVKKLTTQLSKLQEEQFKEYQKWAADVILEARKYFNEHNTSKGVEFILNSTDIVRIDQRQLIPEVASVLSTLEEEMYKKISEDKKRWFNEKFMKTMKRTLEDL